jgi:uncharacterized Zn finger protein
MCKHVAALLLGVGARLDAEPELLFRLRGVDENDLVGDIGSLQMTKQAPAVGKVLDADDMAALFGLDMGEAEGFPVAAPIAATKTAAHGKRAVASKTGGREVAPAKKSSGAKKIAAHAMAARTKPPAARKMQDQAARERL